MCKAAKILSESAASLRDIYQDKHRSMGAHDSVKMGLRRPSVRRARRPHPTLTATEGYTPCLLMLELDAISSCAQCESLLTREGLPGAMLILHDTRLSNKTHTDPIPAGSSALRLQLASRSQFCILHYDVASMPCMRRPGPGSTGSSHPTVCNRSHRQVQNARRHRRTRKPDVCYATSPLTPSQSPQLRRRKTGTQHRANRLKFR